MLLWLRGSPHSAYQHMLVKVRIEIHVELLRGSFHVEKPYHTASPAAQRHSRVILWGPVQTASRMHTIGEILAMEQTDCYFGRNNIKLTIVVQCNSVKFCLRSSVTWVKIKEALRSFTY